MSQQHDTPAQLDEKRRQLPAYVDDLVRSYLVYWGAEQVPQEHADALRDYVRNQSRGRTKRRNIGKLMLPDTIDDLVQVIHLVTDYLRFCPAEVHAALSWIQQVATERARLELIDALQSLPGPGGPILNLVPAEVKS